MHDGCAGAGPGERGANGARHGAHWTNRSRCCLQQDSIAVATIVEDSTPSSRRDSYGREHTRRAQDASMPSRRWPRWVWRSACRSRRSAGGPPCGPGRSSLRCSATSITGFGEDHSGPPSSWGRCSWSSSRGRRSSEEQDLFYRRHACADLPIAVQRAGHARWPEFAP